MSSDATPTPEETRGLEGFHGHVEVAHEASPDIGVTIEDMLADGDGVFVRFTTGGTDRGRMGGIEPTRKGLSLFTMVQYRLEDGKIVERWMEADNRACLRQRGVTELPAA